MSGPAAFGGRWALLLVAALLGGIGLYWWAVPDREAPAPVVAEVRKGEFVDKVTELGELRALHSATVSAPIDEPVIYLAPEGTHVHSGDLLVRFDASKYEVALEDSQAGLQVARADLRKARTELEAQREGLRAEAAQFELEFRLARFALEELLKKPMPEELARARLILVKAQAAFDHVRTRRERLPELVEKGFITRSTLEEVELEYLEAEASLEVARSEFGQVSAGASPLELVQARIRLEQAEVALQRAREAMKSQLGSYEASVEREEANVDRANSLVDKARVRLEKGELRAPRDGLVVYAEVESRTEVSKVQLGMIPFEGQPLLYLPDLSAMVVDAEVSEFDIRKVEVGGLVELRLEAYPGIVFLGEVLQVGTLAKVKRTPAGAPTGLKVFDVTVRIEGEDPRLRPGLTATLDIIAHREEGAVLVPLSAVRSRDGGPVVHVIEGGRVSVRPVVLGPSNEEVVVIREGLRPGERVVLEPYAARRT